jgi:diguanylate cyclase (GGDEF)-like protein/PAS domain S-box-containing protein
MRSARPYPLPDDEVARLQALESYAILDTPPEKDFDHLVALTARIFDVPTVLISLIEDKRQFFKARVGFNPCETSRDVSFCTYAIMRGEVMCVPDATRDPRFVDNALVTGAPFIRFYAGASLVTRSGQRLGTLCIIDTKPRTDFTPEKAETLTGLAELVMDRMELRRLLIEQQIAQSRFDNIGSTSPDAIVCADQDGVITFWNAAAEKLFGYQTPEAIGRSIDIIIPPWSHGGHDAGLARAAAGAPPRMIGKTVELVARNKAGAEFPVELSLSMWQGAQGPNFGAIIRDITQRRENESRLHRLAHFDRLTQLPNRAALITHLDHVLKEGSPATVILLDIDDFRALNDTAGHAWGDLVLTEIARRVRAVVPAAHMVARLGGDEFVAVIDGADPLAATALAGELIEAVEQPFHIQDRTAVVRALIGITLLPDQAESVNDTLINADLALERAKMDRANPMQLFLPALRHAATVRRVCEEQLKQAFERDEFELYYQPQVRLRDSMIVGAEALLRWRHPERGILAPGAFIEVLEGLSISADVGEWALHTACRQAARWRAEGVDDFRVAVNLFGGQFSRGNLAPCVLRALEESGLPPSGLELEITENIVLRHEAAMTAPLQLLGMHGVGVAFDDYGTGFASLSHLKLFPLTKLKIDRQFVRDMCTDRGDDAVVQAIVDLGRSFRFSVVAEGIEMLSQHDALTSKGCDEGQGYLYGRPMPAEVFGQRLLEWRQVA